MATIVGTNGSDRVMPLSPVGSPSFDGWTVSPGVIGGPPTSGPDTILGRNGDDTLAGGRGSDEIHGGNGNDSLHASGFYFDSRDASDRLYGENGNDFLYGAFGDDSLYGGNGDDTLIGGDRAYTTGNDYLDGGRGNDLLDGTTGVDTLIGGAGADTFRFGVVGDIVDVPGTGSGEGRRDVVLDFKQGADVLDLSNFQDYTARIYDLDPPVFLGSGAFGASSGLQVRYEIQDDRTVVQFIGARNVRDEWPQPAGEIELVGVYALTAADVFLGTST